MRIDRNIETRGIRIRITLQTQDVNSHSVATERSADFEGLADALQQEGTDYIQALVGNLQVKP